MPNKYAEKKCWRVPKQRYKLSNWSEYNDALRQRGNIALWIKDDVMKHWYEQERIYDGTGAPKLFSDFAITICHELRQGFKLPLRPCQGFMDSIFDSQEILLLCPDYSCLSKRLATLRLHSPRYKPSSNAIYSKRNHTLRNTSVQNIKAFGRVGWQRATGYGQRNYSELAIQRYKKILDTNFTQDKCRVKLIKR